jgi:hypothetical protein
LRVRGRGEPIRTTGEKAWHSVFSAFFLYTPSFILRNHFSGSSPQSHPLPPYTTPSFIPPTIAQAPPLNPSPFFLTPLPHSFLQPSLRIFPSILPLASLHHFLIHSSQPSLRLFPSILPPSSLHPSLIHSSQPSLRVFPSILPPSFLHHSLIHSSTPLIRLFPSILPPSSLHHSLIHSSFLLTPLPHSLLATIAQALPFNPSPLPSGGGGVEGGGGGVDWPQCLNLGIPTET